MTVITITTKSQGFQIKGEVKKYEHITQIIEEEKIIRLVRNKNWETLVSKDFNRIIAVEQGDAQ